MRPEGRWRGRRMDGETEVEWFERIQDDRARIKDGWIENINRWWD